MPDLSQEWSSDLALGPTGGLALTSEADLTRQRLLRRLLTNPGDYHWHPDYGAGLGRFVGSPVVPAAIQGLVQSQALAEPTVASVLGVNVVADGLGAVGCTVRYTVASDPTTPQILGLSVSADGYSVS